MGKFVYCFILIALTSLLSSCANVPKDKFLNDINQMTQKEITELPPLRGMKDPQKYEQFVRKLLQDEILRSSIYDLAVQSQSAWSSKAILETSWFQTFAYKGSHRLSSAEKEYLLILLDKYTATLSTKDCASLSKGVFRFNLETFAWSTESELNKYLEFTENVLKKGASTKNVHINTPSDNDVVVAIVSIFAKAKEAIPEQELGIIFLPLLQHGTSTEDAICTTNKKLIKLISMLSPKYRDVLFDYIVR